MPESQVQHMTQESNHSALLQAMHFIQLFWESVGAIKDQNDILCLIIG